MGKRYTLSVQCRLASSHVLPNCPPCDRMHGHTWTVRAFWEFVELNDAGMGVNFHTLSAALDELVHDRFDHRHLNDMAPFDEISPTTENLAREIFRTLADGFDPGRHGRLARVEVWEGPDSCVSFEE